MKNIELRRLRCLAALALAASLAGACASAPVEGPSPAVLEALAPTGSLRVGLYPGSPTSIIPGDGAPRGVGHDLGASLAREAGVAFEPHVMKSNNEVLDAVKAGRVDLVFTNATAARAEFIDFAPAALRIEKGYLVPAASAAQQAGDLDRPGVRIGYSKGSTTATELGGLVKHASLVEQPSIEDAIRALREGRLEAFATNKAILFGMSDKLAGSRVLPGRWGEELIALGIPKGRAAALPYVTRFSRAQQEGGAVRQAAQRAGLRGLVPDNE